MADQRQRESIFSFIPCQSDRSIEDRLGPTALAVDEAKLAVLRELLDALGIRVEFA